MTNQYLTFFIRGEEYAVAILRVKEIIEFETVTRVPTTPAHVRGVINLRGAVLPVVDLSAKFGHGVTDPARTTCIVVVETRSGAELLTVGIIADSVSEVVDIADTEIETPPSFGTNVRVDFLTGMAKLDGRLALILDIDRVLSPAEVQQAMEAATETEPAADVA